MADGNPDNVKLLCLDVDGVLTDGSIVIDDHGVESKRFHAHDGLGLSIWLKLGFEVAIITGRQSMALRHRANELGIKTVVQGSANKVADFRSIIAECEVNASEAAVMGDDLADLPVLRLAGYPITVAGAPKEVQSVAAYVTVRPGGSGAVREAVEHLLKAMGRWDDALALFS